MKRHYRTYIYRFTVLSSLKKQGNALSIEGPVFLGIAMLFMISIDMNAQQNPSKAFHYSIGYAGNNFWNPGFSAGVEMPLQHSLRKKTSPEIPAPSGRASGLLKTSLLARMGFYIDPGVHSAFNLQGGLRVGILNRKGREYYTELMPLSAQRTLLPNTYLVEGDHTSKQILSGNWYYAPGAGFGRKAMVEHPVIYSWYGSVSFRLLTPYNTYVMPLLFLEAGVILGKSNERK